MTQTKALVLAVLLLAAGSALVAAPAGATPANCSDKPFDLHWHGGIAIHFCYGSRVPELYVRGS